MSHEQLPEDFSMEKQLEDAAALAAARLVIKGVVEDKDLSQADFTWGLAREDIILARTKIAGMALGLDDLHHISPEVVDMTMNVIFDDLADKDLPRDVLDVKPDEKLDPREREIPILPDNFEKLLAEDFKRFQSWWDKPDAFDIELL